MIDNVLVKMLKNTYVHVFIDSCSIYIGLHVHMYLLPQELQSIVAGKVTVTPVSAARRPGAAPMRKAFNR